MDDLSEVLCTPLPPHTHNHVTERWACCAGDRTPRTEQKRRMMINSSKPPVYVKDLGRTPPLLFITILIRTGGQGGTEVCSLPAQIGVIYFLQENCLPCRLYRNSLYFICFFIIFVHVLSEVVFSACLREWFYCFAHLCLGYIRYGLYATMFRKWWLTSGSPLWREWGHILTDCSCTA